jgi:hypothetical protein
MTKSVGTNAKKVTLSPSPNSVNDTDDDKIRPDVGGQHVHVRGAAPDCSAGVCTDEAAVVRVGNGHKRHH